jgi:hypothetical protein
LKNKVRTVILISLAMLTIYFTSTSVGIIPNRYNFSIIIATIIVFTNFSIFVVSYHLGFKKKAKTFILFTMGGLLVRLLLMIIAIFLSIKFLKVDIVGFIFTFFIWYVFLLFFEILIVQSGIERSKN